MLLPQQLLLKHTHTHEHGSYAATCAAGAAARAAFRRLQVVLCRPFQFAA
jgi:hypothetical protein